MILRAIVRNQSDSDADCNVLGVKHDSERQFLIQIFWVRKIEMETQKEVIWMKILWIGFMIRIGMN